MKQYKSVRKLCAEGFYLEEHKQTKTNSVALSPRANYTDWATATCRRNLVSTFVDRAVSRGQRGGSPTVVNVSFPDKHNNKNKTLYYENFQNLYYWGRW
jgi:hypothetical protein